ncbi:ketohexokinase-like isoform X2 [Pecten maximus]|uniref:ketohexokinase-like isoform X2 n=1 Tax=Pecten maximus TaxID=6579 RepID=UPI0014580D0A|nr:ketohexokinase-like isoform X2 [Pecten maximus]XP_033748279.1 ketohexokinase-like isoform X2 [Pecten maximus]
MKRVLTVGLACLDLVATCETFPKEDTGQIVLDYYWQRGGNASTTSTVLAMLGERSEFMGAMATDVESKFLTENLKSYGVSHDNAMVCGPDIKTPVSMVIINQSNGSRTILHCAKNLPEVSFSHFQTLDLSQYKWIHVEGRPAPDAYNQIMCSVVEYNDTVVEKITISLELEKPGRPELDSLIQYADVVFISKEKADEERLYSKEDVVRAYIKRCKAGAVVICAWGDQGAAALSSTDGVLCTSPVFPPETLVDTLGAGDTFNAATIFALCQGRSVQEAITLGCKVAGTKCGMKGNKGLKDIIW